MCVCVCSESCSRRVDMCVCTESCGYVCAQNRVVIVGVCVCVCAESCDGRVGMYVCVCRIVWWACGYVSV